MAGRARDRWIGAVLGALAVLVLLAVAVVVFVLVVSEPAGEAGSTLDPVEPPASADGSDLGPDGGATPPDDLAAGQTWLGEVSLDAATIATPEARLTDVVAVGDDVLAGPDGTVAGTLQVQATVPFEVVAAELGPMTTVRSGEGRQAVVEREVELFGRVFRVVASGTVDAVDGRLVVEPRTIDIGGPDFLSATIGDVARGLVTIEQPVEGLPEGLVLRGVEVVDDGFRAELSGEDVPLDEVAPPG